MLWFRNVFTAFAQKPVFLGRLEKGVRTVFAEWALDPDMAEIPGGKTGLIVRDFKARTLRLLNRLLTQMERILEINSLQKVTKAVVEAARESLVIGEA